MYLLPKHPPPPKKKRKKKKTERKQGKKLSRIIITGILSQIEMRM